MVEPGAHRYTLWISVAVPSPPPQHIVTRPSSLSERSSSCSSVVISRAPVEPSGWPSAIAPPFTLTRSGSAPSSCSQAPTTDEKASFTSKRSMSLMLSLLRSRILRVAGIGPVSMITGSTPTVVWSTIRARARQAELVRRLARRQQHRRGAVRDLRRVAGGDHAVLLEGRLELGEALRRRAGADALVGRDEAAVDGDRDDLAVEAPFRRSALGALLRAGADLVEQLARQVPLLRDHLGAEALVDQVVVIEQLGRERRADDVLELASDEHRDPAHRLDARADRHVVDAARDQRGAEVDRLLGGAALTVDRRRRRLVRQARPGATHSGRC